MALTYTPPGELGSTCPEFVLTSVDGRRYSSKDFAHAGALVVMFICNHCPYVKAVEDRLLALARDLGPRGAAFVAICSNDPKDHAEHRPENLLARWREKSYGFPYLIDDTQSVARAFGAVCTPDLYVYDAAQRLVYRGRLDDSWRNPEQVQKQELRQAILQVLGGQALTGEQIPSMGCSIKWRAA